MIEQIKSMYKRGEAFVLKHDKLVLGLLILFLCASIVISQFVNIKRTQAETMDLTTEIDRLQDLMEDEQLRYANLQDEKQRLTTERNLIIDEFLANNPMTSIDLLELQENLALSRVMAGATDITGAGVSLLLSDPEGIDYATATATDIIHEQDVMDAVNLLKANGAVAMAVNGERLTATSKLICNGPTILVNRRLLSAPFVITAVGDTEQMMDAIASNNRIQNLASSGKTVRYEQVNEMLIPAFNDNLIIEQAREMMKEVLES